VTKGQLALLWGLAVGVVLVFAALTYVLAHSSPPAQVLVERQAATPVSPVPEVETYLLPQTPNSARALCDRATQAAQEWQPDAGLASAVASWPFATLDDLSGPADWTFTFFSPRTQRVYVLNVYPDQVTLIRDALSPYPLPVLSSEEWRVDSHQALNAWLDSGGGDVLRSYSIVDVSARLRLEDGRAIWSVIGSVQGGQPSLTIWVDAVSGEKAR